MQVGVAEAGIPQVLLAAIELIANSFGSDNELAQACRCSTFPLTPNLHILNSLF